MALQSGELDQEAMNALFTEDGGDAQEEQEASREEESSEPEIEPEESEDAASEEGEESPDEEELDWEEVEERYRDAYMQKLQEAERWQKAHSKIQSEFTKRSHAQREEESTLSAMREKARLADQWSTLLEQNPNLQKVLERELAQLNDPLADLPDYLKQDPAIQYMQRYTSQLEQKLAQFEQKTKVVDSWQAEQQQAQSRQKLDGLLKEAGDKFKSMFGKDMGEDEQAQVLEYMVQNQYYQNGRIPVMEVFGNQYEKTLTMKRDQELRAKAKKFGVKSKPVHPGRVAKAQEDASTPEEAIHRALLDQGIEL